MDKIKFSKSPLCWGLIVNNARLYGYSIVLDRGLYKLDKGVTGQNIYDKGYSELALAKYELINIYYQDNN